MSRKHYIALARALKDSGASIDTVAAVANVCQSDNPLFDADRFMAAAGFSSDAYRVSGGFGPKHVEPVR